MDLHAGDNLMPRHEGGHGSNHSRISRDIISRRETNVSGNMNLQSSFSKPSIPADLLKTIMKACTFVFVFVCKKVCMTWGGQGRVVLVSLHCKPWINLTSWHFYAYFKGALYFISLFDSDMSFLSIAIFTNVWWSNALYGQSSTKCLSD